MLLHFLRQLAFECLTNDCKIAASKEAEPGIVNVDDFLAGLSATALISDDLWASIPSAAAQVKSFKDMTESLSSLLRWIFAKQPAFSHVCEEQRKASATQLAAWDESLRSQVLQHFTEPKLLESIEKFLLTPVKKELAVMRSAGLDGVPPIVDMYTENLLSAGLGPSLLEEVLVKIPQQHKLRALVEAFGQARC